MACHSLLTCPTPRIRSQDPIGVVYYECARSASGWNAADTETLLLLYRDDKWLAIHAPKGSSLDEVLATDSEKVVFASTESILQPGAHTWQAPFGIGDLSWVCAIARAMFRSKLLPTINECARSCSRDVPPALWHGVWSDMGQPYEATILE